MASWNSGPLHVTYQLLGWSAFSIWAVSIYPQVILNLRRRSVVGLSFDYILLNLTKQSSYLIYNMSLYFSKAVQKQYFERYGYEERGSQKVSKLAIGIVSVAWLTAAICFFIALPTHSWLWLISIFNTIQACLTVIKYVPQAFMNFTRKSTEGFSIVHILLDFSGGMANFGQMAVQSVDQGSWNNFSGNLGKVLLSLVSIFFDIVFICQHYVLYHTKKAFKSVASSEDEINEHFLPSSDADAAAVAENV